MAVVLERPRQLSLCRLDLVAPGDEDVVVDIEWSGISTGTEKLLWLGRMPAFPGMGYPLVPGYESVGRVRAAGCASRRSVGECVFVPGARCFNTVRGLFGGAASRVVVPGSRVMPVAENMAEEAVLLALAATARHALAACTSRPGLIVGHGVLGRLLARLALIDGLEPPVVWERNADRLSGASGYPVIRPEDDSRRDYACIVDASGDADLLDELVLRLAPGGEIVLAGFYSQRPSFAFAPAFMRELRLKVVAEWKPEDLLAVKALVESGSLSLAQLITHRFDATQADSAYRRAFEDPACLKMVLDWRHCDRSAPT
jgi:3-hydroxyethyl bacteriochlorophyllide a dehydrogenase